MTERITPRQFSEAAGVEDWRALFSGVCAHFRTGSFAVGVALVDAIGSLADATDHHPDVDLRYSGVTVRLRTHEVEGLSERDVELARRISEAACQLGVPADPSAVQDVQIAIDALVGPEVIPFWRAVLGGCRAGVIRPFEQIPASLTSAPAHRHRRLKPLRRSQRGPCSTGSPTVPSPRIRPMPYGAATRWRATALLTARALAAVAALCLGLAACGGAGGTNDAVRVRDFRVIEVGKTRLQIAADGRSAILQVETNPPTVCAIAYGRTVSLGSIADDPNMGGTAISRHVVILGGLTPGTIYRFRLTATDAQGRVFQTPKLTTFTTPRQSATSGPDIAIGAQIIAVSSQWSDAYRAAHAVDGKLSTEWASAGDGDRAFITIDLGRQRKITGIAFISREMSDGSAITRTFAVVVDGRRRFGPFPAGNQLNPHVVPVSFTGRFLRFEVVQSTGGNTGATEIQVFSRS